MSGSSVWAISVWSFQWVRVEVGRGRKKERQPEVQFSPQDSKSHICNIQGSIIGITERYLKKKKKKEKKSNKQLVAHLKCLDLPQLLALSKSQAFALAPTILRKKAKTWFWLPRARHMGTIFSEPKSRTWSDNYIYGDKRT